MVPVKELNEMRAYFESGITLKADFRKMQLKKWKSVLEKNEQEIYKALYADLKKSPEECWVTENGFLLAEINQAISELDQWMKPVSVNTNLVNLPSSSFIMKEPLGVVLVIAPWNYPLMLLLVPVIGALAAGNCVVLKSSEHAVATTALVKKMVQENFDQRYLYFAEGDGAEIIPAMMNEFVFDHVFFTGSTSVGKSVYEMAAKNLVPVTLELGGKSPCVVEADANIKVAARRIVMTKFSNAGQMCVAPDFLLVHHSVKDLLIKEMIAVIKKFFGNNAEDCYEYGKLSTNDNSTGSVNISQKERLYMAEETIKRNCL
jgi:aldehyde dehydrogenase (NAD+)